MDAHVVIGANYGDEGKGLMTDFLVRRHSADVVVRFNGGAQAGHTVTDGDMRHVFSHFGSGTLAGAFTYLSRFFVCNPILFEEEFLRLLTPPRVGVDPNAMVTTPWDMLLNQEAEKARSQRHGSCGVGFNETIHRCSDPKFATPFHRLYKTDTTWLAGIVLQYVPRRCKELGLDKAATARCMNFRLAEPFLKACRFMRDACILVPPELLSGKRIVFEGAQGLLLCQSNEADFPHLTRSHTGVRNVVDLAPTMGVDKLHLVYVSRTYLTRHGAGPLPNEWDPNEVPKGIRDDTNLPHPFQGTLRFAPLDEAALTDRILRDADIAGSFRGSVALAVTCQDQYPLAINAAFSSSGPTAADVTVHDPDWDVPRATEGVATHPQPEGTLP